MTSIGCVNRIREGIRVYGDYVESRHNCAVHDMQSACNQADARRSRWGLVQTQIGKECV